jgi:hypothetical protein
VPSPCSITNCSFPSTVKTPSQFSLTYLLILNAVQLRKFTSNDGKQRHHCWQTNQCHL